MAMVIRDKFGHPMCNTNQKKQRLYCPCTDCGGKPYVRPRCPCGKHSRTNNCSDCGGGSICDHEIRRNVCKICDPAGYLISLLRGALRRAKNGERMDGRTIDIVGCTVQEVLDILAEICDYYNRTKKYGEFRFDMVTLNFDIDHFLPLKPVEPISPEELRKRLHWTNLRPMPHKENMEKGNRVENGPSPDEEREIIRKLRE